MEEPMSGRETCATDTVKPLEHILLDSQHFAMATESFV